MIALPCESGPGTNHTRPVKANPFVNLTSEPCVESLLGLTKP